MYSINTKLSDFLDRNLLRKQIIDTPTFIGDCETLIARNGLRLRITKNSIETKIISRENTHYPSLPYYVRGVVSLYSFRF